jgi:hypothetical protein
MLYQYEPLRKGEIRLLALEPAASVLDSAVTCSLKHVSIEDDIEYGSLSYVWGDPGNVTPVACDGGEINVTVNLHSALRHLRYTEQVRILWVDAICINQSDLEERSQQVLLMASIYRQARGVLVWLGEETEDVKFSFESIKMANSFFPPPEAEFTDEATMRQAITEDAYALSDEGKPNLFEYDWNPIVCLLRRPWFERKWVIQELAHAREAALIIGNMSQDWILLATLVNSMVFFGLPPQFIDTLEKNAFSLHFPPMNHVAIMQRMRKLRVYSQIGIAEIGILDLLWGTRNFKCFDPKDQIIAILSLVEDVEDKDEEITPNYRIDTEAYFKQVAAWAILKQNSIRLLSFISNPSASSPLSLPSWVPDFSGIGDRSPLGIDNNTHFYACGDSLQVRAWISHDQRTLRLSGIVADTIRILAPCLSEIPLENPLDRENNTTLEEQVRVCHSMASEYCPETPIEEREEAFCRTMLCDLTDRAKQAPSDYSAYFREFLLALDSRIGEAEEDAGGPEKEKLKQENNYQIYAVKGSLAKFARSHRFCITSEGRMGQVQKAAEVGDLICVFEGGRVPFTLRPNGGHAFSLVGESYVHGIMQGEAMNGKKDSMREFTVL